jgi:hypothetical protein
LLSWHIAPFFPPPGARELSSIGTVDPLRPWPCERLVVSFSLFAIQKHLGIPQTWNILVFSSFFFRFLASADSTLNYVSWVRAARAHACGSLILGRRGPKEKSVTFFGKGTCWGSKRRRYPSCPSYTWSILMSLDYVPLSTLMVMMIKFGEPDFHEFSHGGPGGIRWLHHVCWLIIPLCSNWTQSILVLRRVFRTRNSTPNVSQKCVWIESHSETT